MQTWLFFFLKPERKPYVPKEFGPREKLELEQYEPTPREKPEDEDEEAKKLKLKLAQPAVDVPNTVH